MESSGDNRLLNVWTLDAPPLFASVEKVSPFSSSGVIGLLALVRGRALANGHLDRDGPVCRPLARDHAQRGTYEKTFHWTDDFEEF